MGAYLTDLQKLDGATLRNFVDPKHQASPQELQTLLAIVKNRNLNPFTKEVYFIKYGNNPAQIVVSKDAFMKRAEQNPNYDGFESGIIYEDASGELKNKKWVILLSLCLAILFFITKFPFQNEITMVDVGRGDSLFLRDWKGRNVLIDVGGREEIRTKESWQKRTTKSNAEKTLIPYLKSRGIDTIDTLILTNPNADYAGDVLKVVKKFAVKKIFISRSSLNDADFLNKLKETRAFVHVVKQGDKLPIFDHHLQVLSGTNKNDQSLVLYGQFFRTRFLFMSNLTEEDEVKLMQLYPKLKTDVLKVGQHGAKNSSHSKFLQQIEPAVALISVGKNNQSKSPNQEMIERLNRLNAKIYRTDERGAIKFSGWTKWQLETVQ